MNLKITKNKPFSIDDKDNIFKNDRLKREQSIVNLTTVINSIDEPFVISLNGTWGSGKTTFIRLWKAYLENDGYKSLYFNAWENDFSKEPFLSIVSEINEQIIEFNKQSDGELKATAKVFYNKGMALALKSLPAIIKLLSNGILNVEMLKEIVGESKDDLSEVFSKISENLVHEKTLQKEFRKSLEELTEKVGNNKKVVFFIDDLDRCRPNYAVELLENIKHFFNVKGLVFVLAIDKQQLGYSLQTLYGNNMDTEGYLRRFIDLNFNLPIAKSEDFINNLPQYDLVINFVRKDYSAYKAFLNNIKRYSTVFKLTLRDLEHLYIRVSVAIRIFDTSNLVLENLVPFLLVLRIKNFNLYHNFISNKIDANDLLENLKKDNKEFSEYIANPRERTLLEMSLYLTDARSISSNTILSSINTGVAKNYSNEIVKIFEDFKKEDNYGNFLQKAEEIIEFSGSFQLS